MAEEEEIYQSAEYKDDVVIVDYFASNVLFHDEVSVATFKLPDAIGAAKAILKELEPGALRGEGDETSYWKAENMHLAHAVREKAEECETSKAAEMELKAEITGLYAEAAEYHQALEDARETLQTFQKVIDVVRPHVVADLIEKLKDVGGVGE